MASISTVLRRTLLLVTISVGVGAAFSWWRRHSTTPTPTAPPQWPDLTLIAGGGERGASAPSSDSVASRSAPAAPSGNEATGDEVTDESVAADSAWVPAEADGSAPATHPVKAKDSSGIFHVPGGRFYDRTKADRCYATGAAAEADGYRRSKS